MSVIATVTRIEQVGPDTWKSKRISRVFDEKRSIADVLLWARHQLEDDQANICDVEFSEYTGSSI